MLFTTNEKQQDKVYRVKIARKPIIPPHTNPVFTINFLTYQPGGLVPMEFLQVPLEFTSPPYQDNFVQGLDQRLKLIGSVGFEMYGCT